MESIRTWLCLLLAALCFGCGASEPDYQEPPQDFRSDQKGEWVFKRRFESIQKGGKEETVRFIQQELGERLFLWPFRYEVLFDYLKNNGGPESLPLLEEWLNYTPGVIGTDYVSRSESAPLAADAWYEISKRQCKTHEQLLSLIMGTLLKKQFACMIVSGRYVEDMKGLLPESRGALYTMMLHKNLNYYEVPGKEAFPYILSEPGFKPKPEEIENVWKQGGSFGRTLLVHLSFVKDAAEVEAFWQGCKSSPDPVERIEGFLHFAEKGPEGVEAMIAHLKEVRSAPTNERNEYEVYDGTLCLSRPGIPVSERKAIGDYADWVLGMSPPLKLYDVREFEHKPGRRSRASEADGILASRKSLREAAEQLRKSSAEKK